MTQALPTLLITGGSGFIGSCVVRTVLARGGWKVVNLDKLTYAASPDSLASVQGHPGYAFEHLDICDGPGLRSAFARHRPAAVMHLAAESHVDRSIDAPSAFIQTNVVGTFTLLEVAAEYWRGLDEAAKAAFRFHHVSTDEVFGSLGKDGRFLETTPYAPTSPYSASKAGADHLVRAWGHTFGLPVVLSNCSNNYGPFQFPEKLIPLMIIRALEEKPLPVYGDGLQVRDWLHVEDHVSGLLAVLERGRLGESYNIGGHGERPNIWVVKALIAILDRLKPSSQGPRSRLITHVTDRPGHDVRYAIDPAKIEAELGWKPAHDVEAGLEATVRWYLDNEAWWRAILDGRYDGGRLGQGKGG